MFWFTLFLWAVSFVLSEVLRPKPKITNARPGGLGDFSFPTATEGRSVPLIFGTVRIDGPNVVWYGDLRPVPMKKHISTGLFSSTTQITGYQYFIGLQFAFCRGEVNELRGIWINDKKVSNAVQNDGDAHQIQDFNLFGGKDSGGGINGLFRFYAGSPTQTANPYFAGVTDNNRSKATGYTVAGGGTGYAVNDIIVFLGGTGEIQTNAIVTAVDMAGAITSISIRAKGEYKVVPTNPVSISGGTGTGATFTLTWTAFLRVPAYTGTSYGMWEGGYLGNSTSLQPWAFELRRCPNQLVVTSGKHAIGGFDANPACVLYEILTDNDWGLAFNSGDIDLDNFRAVAATLYDEGNGFSQAVDSQIQVADFINQIEKQIDGVMVMDRTTGKFKINLVRSDYTLADIPALNETNIIEIKNFTRGSWHQTSNNIRVQYTDRAKQYKSTYALAQDSANIVMQGNLLVNVESSYPAVMVAGLANQLAWRDLRVQAYPLAKAQFIVDRTMHFLDPGQVIKWSDANLGITDLVMRITRVDLGKLEDGQITLDVVQDVFYYNTPSYADAQDSLWVSNSAVPLDFPVGEKKIMEAPYKFCVKTDINPGVLDRVFVGARYQSDRTSAFQIWADDGSGYLQAGDVQGHLLIGKLNSTLGEGVTQGTTSIIILCDPDTQADMLATIEATTATGVGRDLLNIAQINDELIGFLSVSASGDNISLDNVYRGLFDTIQETHTSATNVWLLSASSNITDNGFVPLSSVDIKLLPDGVFGALDIADATATTLTFNDRARKPYPPSELYFNGVTGWPTSADVDYQSGFDLSGQGLFLGLNRRDYRCADEVAAVVGESFGFDFPAANTTQYRATMFNDPDGADTNLFQSDWFSDAQFLLRRAKILRYIPGDLNAVATNDVFSYSAGDLATVSSNVWTVQGTYDNGTSRPATPSEGIQISAGGDAILVPAAGVVLHSQASTVLPVSLISSDPVTIEFDAAFQGPNENLGIGTIEMFLDQHPGQTNHDMLFQFQGAGLGSPKHVSCTFRNASGGTTSATSTVLVSIGSTHHFKVVVTSGIITSIHVDAVSLSLIGSVFGSYNATRQVGFGILSYEASGSTYDPKVANFQVTGTSETILATLPTRMAVSVETQHVSSDDLAIRPADKNLYWPFDVTFSELTGLSTLGVFAGGDYSYAYAAASTGTFTVNVELALASNLKYSIDNGAWTTVVAAGLTTGTFAVTSGDSIRFLYDAAASDTPAEAFIELLDDGSAVVAFGIVTF